MYSHPAMIDQHRILFSRAWKRRQILRRAAWGLSSMFALGGMAALFMGWHP